VTSLVLTGRGATRFPHSLTGYATLASLDVSDNAMRALPEELPECLGRLRNLMARENRCVDGCGSGWVVVAMWQWQWGKNERNRSSIGGVMIEKWKVDNNVAVAVWQWQWEKMSEIGAVLREL
jgi:hypothetical protein